MNAATPRIAQSRPKARASFWVPFFIPVLIGPPMAIVGTMFGWGWLGLLVALGGTFFVVQDTLSANPSARLVRVRAAGLSVLFCATWRAIAWGVLAGIATLIPKGPYENPEDSGELADKDSNLD